MSALRLALIAVAGGVVLVPAAQAQVCLGSLNKVEYPAGFQVSDLSSATQAGVVNPPPNSITLAPGQTSGTVISQIISSEIQNAATPGNYTIGHIHITATASFPAPCPAPPTSSLGGGNNATGNPGVNLYYSVNGGNNYDPGVNSYTLVTFPGSAASGEVLIDNVTNGMTGNQLTWKAVLLSGGVAGCTPLLTSLAIGYEGIPNGTYQSSDPIPIGNVLLRTTYETPSASWTDRGLRGHIVAKKLYDPDTSPVTDYTDPLNGAPPNAWGGAGDGGSKITYSGACSDGSCADTRLAWYNSSGTPTQWDVQRPLQDWVLPQSFANLWWETYQVYDFGHGGDFGWSNSAWVIEYVKGWADGYTETSQRAWGLGPIVKSSPAVEGPPGSPWWLDGSGTPAAERTLYGTPCASVANSFVTTWSTRPAVAIVGSQDGMYHAFDLGSLRWCDDPSTSTYETHGWFYQQGARAYGDGHEVWAFAPVGEMDSFRQQPPRAWPYAVGHGFARATTDAPVTVADLCIGPPPVSYPPGGNASCSYKTVMVGPETSRHPYLTALDVTNTSTTPIPLWPTDWPPSSEMDTTFQGADWAPAVGPTLLKLPGAPPTVRRYAAAVTSGMASNPTDLYLYLIDMQAGTTWHNGATRDGWGRAKLNVANSGPANCSGTVLGSVGSPVMVDSDLDGVVDRIYLADTKGCVYKVETSTMSVCTLASVGESVFAPIGVFVPGDVANRVQIFVAGADNPDALDLGNNPPHYHLTAMEDDDKPTFCNAPKSLFVQDLTPVGAPAGIVHKVWAAPAVNADGVYVATSVGDLADPCGYDANNPGLLLGYANTPSVTGVARNLLTYSLGGNGVGGVRIFDGHLFANSASGSTTVFGKPSSWGSTTGTRPRAPTLFSTPLWSEH